MDKIIEAFLEELRQLGYGVNTQRGVGAAVRELVTEQSLSLAQDLTPAALSVHLTWLAQRPKRYSGTGSLAGATLERHYYALNLFCTYLVENHHLPTHPMSSLPRPSYESPPRPCPRLEEVEALYAACYRAEERALLGLFYGCGLRRGEGERLDLSDIQLAQGLVYVRYGKGHRRRVVPMSNRVKKDLAFYLQKRPRKAQTKAFLLNRCGRRMRGGSFDRLLRGLVERAGTAPYTLHCLRHGIATHLLEAGVPLEGVQAFLGHQCLESTQRYTHKQAPQ